MSTAEVFSTKLPGELKKKLDEVCRQFGLRKSFVVEQAIREKLEDLLDTFDLEKAEKEATGFKPWADVKKDLQRRGKL